VIEAGSSIGTRKRRGRGGKTDTRRIAHLLYLRLPAASNERNISSLSTSPLTVLTNSSNYLPLHFTPLPTIYLL